MPINLLKMKTRKQRRSKISVDLRTKFSNNPRFFVYRKSQIHTLETIIVLAIFFILVIFVFVYYSKITESNIEIKEVENLQLNAIRIAEKVLFLPEIQCSQDGVVKDNCIDLLNVATALDVITLNEIHYFDMFSFSRISIEEVYPDTEEIAILYDRSLESYSSKEVIHLPILLFDSLNDENSFGVIVVEVFSK